MSLKTWREALEMQADPAARYYHAEMMTLLGDAELEIDELRDQLNEVNEALRELRRAGKEFLDASNEASNQLLTKQQALKVMERWQHAGVRLRQLTRSVALVRGAS